VKNAAQTVYVKTAWATMYVNRRSNAMTQEPKQSAPSEPEIEAEWHMPRITVGESRKEFLTRVLNQLRYELTRKFTPPSVSAAQDSVTTDLRDDMRLICEAAIEIGQGQYQHWTHKTMLAVLAERKAALSELSSLRSKRGEDYILSASEGLESGMRVKADRILREIHDAQCMCRGFPDYCDSEGVRETCFEAARLLLATGKWSVDFEDGWISVERAALAASPEAESSPDRELIDTVKEMAKRCYLQNWEQISNAQGAIGAVRMIQSEYLGLIEAESKSGHPEGEEK
jgi:hypothetical protein